MQVIYCELWRDQPAGPMSEAVARKLDEEGEPYTVVVGATVAPEAVIEVCWKNAYLGVSFKDVQGRTDLQYSFTRVDDQRLFLSDVTSWHYPEGARFEFEAARIESHTYRPDGYVSRRVDDVATDRIEVSELLDVPVEAHWEQVPAFGRWTSVARYDRALAA
ncbi:MAG TPA: hypothetical protein VH912_00735 [Streptosporangiaceae bacterium]|jgi:hypothetical protein